MSKTQQPYRHAYEDKRHNRAYRLFVDGSGTIRELAERTKVSARTIGRYSVRDEWVSERDERTNLRTEQNAAARLLASTEAAMATEDGLRRQLAANPDQKTLILSVLKRHQKFWDRVESRVDEVLAEAEREAATKAKPIQLGKLIPILKAAEIASANVRKAYGIPDVSKIEWEDTTPAAKRHADTIRQRRAARLVANATKAGGEAEPLTN